MLQRRALLRELLREGAHDARAGLAHLRARRGVPARACAERWEGREAEVGLLREALHPRTIQKVYETVETRLLLLRCAGSAGFLGIPRQPQGV